MISILKILSIVSIISCTLLIYSSVVTYFLVREDKQQGDNSYIDFEDIY
jgi:hypothetical protein